ncbi:glycosyltransferase family 2 protein [Candidatus Roizmanbacteria bacterium]|nr:glycosyltransferase family 2 protein [Candidatus Roizmanbacteria bacterium]
MKPVAAILIPTHNSSAILDRTLISLNQSRHLDKFDIFVIDNASTDDTRQVTAKHRKVSYMQLRKNFLMSKAINTAFRRLKIAEKYEYIIIMAHDVMVNEVTLWNMYRFMTDNRSVSLAGPVAYNFNSNEVSSAGLSVNPFTSLLVHYLPIQQSVPVNHFASAWIMKSSVFKEISGFDEILFPMVFEEPDLGERLLRKGYKIDRCLTAYIWHPIYLDDRPSYEIIKKERIYSSSSKTYLFFRNRLLYMKKHAKSLHFPFFLFFIYPAVLIYYLPSVPLKYWRWTFQGIKDGLIYSLTKSKDYIRNKNNEILYT